MSNHLVKSAQEMGWDKLRNGKLLAAAAANEFDLVLTVDRNLKHQQNLEHLPIAVVVLIGTSNRLSDLLPLLTVLEESLRRLTPRTLVEVLASG